MSEARWMIYGANGYTGKLTAREAASRGLKPILAGRSEQAVKEIAHELGLEARVFSLDDAAGVIDNIKDLRAVLHCAGPFSVTSKPMIDACLASRVHYLDITGEMPVFEHAHSLSEQARHRDVVLIPGVGFDIVPSDCLAASLVRALPAATQLVLAFEAAGGPSPGTAKTSVEGLAKGGAVRVDGEIKRVPLAYKSREIPFAHANRTAMTIPWGDVYTAFVSTGIGNIEVYMAVPPATVKSLRWKRLLQPLLSLSFVQNFMKKRIEQSVKGPSDEKRQNSSSQLWGQVTSSDGRQVSATMTAPNGYDLTVTASLGIVEHLMNSDVEGGYYTPSLLMGADYASSLPGVEMSVGQVVGD
ncbi:MAG TPA: saccharopine dehydrogenase NADP-binding domain-containing protein [Xanthomonadales bacterium]|nr:saccharopine dehydrogenase NADP-binding domain-containing protein [Xanthomonadales bacterium]